MDWIAIGTIGEVPGLLLSSNSPSEDKLANPAVRRSNFGISGITDDYRRDRGCTGRI